MIKDKHAKPELISGAGSWASLQSAIASGADGVYFGIKSINMRNLASNFDILEISKVMNLLHKNKRKGYLALNVIVYDEEISKVKKILFEAKKCSVDAVIAWDMAVISLAKEIGLKIHLSTQASVSNFLALKQYHQLGVKRVVLARENELKAIKKIIQKAKKENINCEVETFIHGAMCVSISGRCFLSEYSFSKSANRGECLQPCRREFLIKDTQGDCDYIIGKDYLLSPKDLCTIDFLDELIAAGISAFKIEGRNRSPEYVGVVTDAYRKAIDAFYENKLNDSLKSKLKKELKSVYNRGFSSGFYWGEPKNAISRKLENTHEKVYTGQVIKFYKKINVAEIKVFNEPIKEGDNILCIGKNTPASFAKVDSIEINHKPIKILEKGHVGGIKLPFEVKRKDKVFIWRKKVESSV